MASSSSSNSNSQVYFGSTAPVSTDHSDNDSYFVTDDGTSTGTPREFFKFDADTGVWISVPLGGETCPAPMTRAELVALSGSYSTKCHYIITNHDKGNVGPALIMLHATDADTLSMDVSVQTQHDDMAWHGTYDIGPDRFRYLTDNVRNHVTGQGTIEDFPWGVSGVVDNVVQNADITYTSGTFSGNHIANDAVVIINGNQFVDNHIDNEANVNYTSTTGVFLRNTVSHDANVTISGGDFIENIVATDATVNSSTTGDVDNNEFGSLSSINVSGSANLDACTVKQSSNLTLSGGSLADTTIDEDAQVILVGGVHYENHFGTSVVFTQVAGTDAYVRYSSFNGTTAWTHGQVIISNVDSYTSTINTTGSSGLISNSHFNRAYMANLKDVPDLTITDCSITDYAQVSVNAAARLYLYRSNVNSGSRILVSAGATQNSSNLSVTGYGYTQTLQGVLTANSSVIGGVGYIQHNSTGTNTISNCSIDSRGSMRFLAESTGCRIYYTSATSGGKVYHNGSSLNGYIYYCEATSNANIYSVDSTSARIYYSTATSNGSVYSTSNVNTHYMYYCFAASSGRVHMLSCDGSRMYSITSQSTSIARLQNSDAAGRFYYSSVTAYYYLFVTLTATRSGIHAYGRRTKTVTDPSNGTALENFT